MDIFYEGLLAFWKKLNELGVKYIMVGGFAVNMHGYMAATNKEVDFWLKDTLENRKGLRKALSVLGFGDFDVLETLQFIPGFTQFNIGGIVIDIMTSLKGLEQINFDECWNYASTADLDGVPVKFLHINHLIQSKKAAGRPRDLDDIEQLEKIRAFGG